MYRVDVSPTSGSTHRRQEIKARVSAYWCCVICCVRLFSTRKLEVSDRWWVIPNIQNLLIVLTCIWFSKLKSFFVFSNIMLIVPCTGASAKNLYLSYILSHSMTEGIYCNFERKLGAHDWVCLCAWYFIIFRYNLNMNCTKCSSVVCWFSSEVAACQGSGDTLPKTLNVIICILGKHMYYLYNYAYECWFP